MVATVTGDDLSRVGLWSGACRWVGWRKVHVSKEARGTREPGRWYKALWPGWPAPLVAPPLPKLLFHLSRVVADGAWLPGSVQEDVYALPETRLSSYHWVPCQAHLPPAPPGPTSREAGWGSLGCPV